VYGIRQRRVTSIATAVSGTFLYAIAALNVVILWAIVKVFREMRTGRYDEAQLEACLRCRSGGCRLESEGRGFALGAL
jgi:high-affinity nickel permease